MDKLIVVALDNPFPPNYGGAAEMWFKLAALYEAKVQIELHAFAKPDRMTVAEQLQAICPSVTMYPRKTGLASWLSSEPYPVRTRRNPALLERLLKAEDPVLIEGIHGTHDLAELKRKRPDLPVVLRMHNLESRYYGELADASSGPRSWFYRGESRKLAKWEPVQFQLANAVAALSPQEALMARDMGARAEWIPAFGPFFPHPPVPPQPGTFVFVGNFAVESNRLAGERLIEQVLPHLQTGERLLLAGRSIPASWGGRLDPKLVLYADPPDIKPLLDLADVTLLPLTGRSGVKIKLLEAVSLGKKILASPDAVAGSGLEDVTLQAPVEGDWGKLFRQAANDPFLQARTERFRELYDPLTNVRRLFRLFDEVSC